MSKAKSAGKIGAILAVLVLLAVLSACCGCGGLVTWGPGMIAGMFLEDEPLTTATVLEDPSISKSLEERFKAGGEVRITGQELSQLVEPANSMEVEAFWVDVTDDQAALDLSLYMDESGGKYLNMHIVGDMEMDQGWFTHLQIDELVLSGWDLGAYVTGQELAQNGNQQLARQRGENPEVGALLDEVEHVSIRDGAFFITLSEGGYERIQAIETH